MIAAGLELQSRQSKPSDRPARVDSRYECSVTSRRRRALAALAAVLASGGVVVGVLAVLGVFAASKSTPPSSFAFDSLYEDRRGEALVTEEILAGEMAAERKLEREGRELPSGKTAIKSARCTVSPPPPSATRMLCRVLVSVEELPARTRPARVNGWAAVVELNPHDGALTVRLTRLERET